MIWGKLIGMVLGYLVARIPGAVVGLVIGHLFDYGLGEHYLMESLFTSKAKRQKVQAIFFKATFCVMGYVARHESHTEQAHKGMSQAEVEALDRLMQQLHIAGESRQSAVEYYNQGKNPHFNVDELLMELEPITRKHKALMQLFLELQLQAAYAEGFMVDAKRAKIIYVCERLGLDRTVFARLNSMHQAEERFKEYLRRHYYEQFQKMRNTSTVIEAYKLLGVDPEASDAQVKRAYRKLMSEHHPDRLIAQGLPDEMIKIATQKTQEIKKAYDLIRETKARL